MSSYRARLALLLFPCLLGAGCAGNGPAPASSTSSFDTIQTTIFNVRCVSAGCHNSSDRAGNLVLVAGTSYGDLINVTPFNSAAQARGLLRVIPGDPDHSFLLIKLNGPPSDEGSPMPLVPPLLSATDIAVVRDWILAGAPGSSVPTTAPTVTASPTSTATAVDTPTSTSTARDTGTPTLTPTGTLPATLTPTTTPSTTPTQPPTATATPTVSPSQVPTPTFSLASTFPQIQATIFTPTCLSLSCHNATDQGGSLVLEAGVAYANLVNVAPFNVAAHDAGMRRVDPGDPANSFLITKLTLPHAFDPDFGSRMPSGLAPLTAEQINNIRDWILRGALADETPPAGN